METTEIPVSIESKFLPAARAKLAFPAVIESMAAQSQQTEATEDILPAVNQEEIMVFPKQKSNSYKSKNHDKHEKHKSKSERASKKFSAAATPAEERVTAAPISDDDNLVREELWYHVDDAIDDADESDAFVGKVVLKGKILAAPVANERPHVVGKLYEPPSLHASKKSAKPAKDVIVPSTADTKINDKSDLDKNIPSEIKTVATESPKATKSPSAPFEFNPAPPRRIKRRVILMSNDASTQTITPPKTPPSGLAADIIHNPSPEIPSVDIPVIEKAAIVRPAVIISSPKTLGKYTAAKAVTAVSAAGSKMPKSTGKRLVMPATLPDSYTGSDEVYMKTLKNVDAGDDLMIVSNPKEESVEVVLKNDKIPVQFQDVQSGSSAKSDLHNLEEDPRAAPPKEHIPSAPMSADSAAVEALAAIKDDPTVLYKLLSAITAAATSNINEEKKHRKEKKERKEKHGKDKDGEKKSKKLKKSKGVDQEGEDFFEDLLGDDVASVASLPVLYPTP
jgi:hypothetical protein